MLGILFCGKNIGANSRNTVLKHVSYKTNFFKPFSSVPSLGMNSSVNLGMPWNEHFFPRITEATPRLFRGIFSERNSVVNPTGDQVREYVCRRWRPGCSMLGWCWRPGGSMLGWCWRPGQRVQYAWILLETRSKSMYDIQALDTRLECLWIGTGDQVREFIDWYWRPGQRVYMQIGAGDQVRELLDW